MGVGIADADTERGAPIDGLGRGLLANEESDALRLSGRGSTDPRAAAILEADGIGGCWSE